MTLDDERLLQESDNDGTSSMPSDVLKSTFKIYGSIFLCLFALFCCLRQRFPRFYNIRSWVPELKCDLALDQHGFIRWAWELYYIPEDEIMDQCGMDALCFLRIIRFGFKLSLLSIFNSLWLMPIYATAPSETGSAVDRLEKLSTSHLVPDSPRFFATVVAAYVLFIYTMYLILQEFEWYTRHRHRFLSRQTPRNYAVYVSGIPLEYRSSFALTDFFRECFSREGILEAHVALEIPELEGKLAARKALVAKLEHAINLEIITGVTPTHRSVDLRKGEVVTKDTIEVLEKDLEKLNKDIHRSIQKVEVVNDRFRSHLKKFQTQSDLSNGLVSTNTNRSKWDFSTQASSRRFELFPIIDETETRNGQDTVIDVNTEEVAQEYTDIETGYDTEGEMSHEVVVEDDDFEAGIFEALPLSPILSGSCASSPENVPPDDDSAAAFADIFLGARLPTRHVEPVPSSGDSSNDETNNESTISTTDKNAVPIQAQVLADDLSNHKGKKGLSRSTQISAGDCYPIANGSDRIQLSQTSDSPQWSRKGDMERQAVLKRRNTQELSSMSVWTTSSSASGASSRLSKLSTSRFSDLHKDVSRVAKSGSKVAKQAVKGGTRHMSKAVKEVNPENVLKVAEFGVKNMKKAGSAGLDSVTKVKDLSVENFKQMAAFMLGEGEGVPREAGFVAFTKLSTTQAALQMIHHPTPFVMNVEEAPEPDDIYWKNVGMPHKARQVGRLISLGLSAALCLFWTVPVSFISSLAQINSLKESVPFLEKWIERCPWIEPLLEQIAPLLLLILNGLLPEILTEISKFEGHIAGTTLDASLFVKLATFMIIQTFFVSAITGGIAAQINNILDDPQSLVDMLAKSLPEKSTYFVQILLVNTFLGQGLELLRVFPLCMAWIRTKVGPNLTEDERKMKFMVFRPLTDPYDFQHAELLSQIVLYFMVVFVYSTIAPVTSYFVAFCWLLLGSGYRHQLIYNYSMTPDSGGKLWSKFIGIALVCMLIAQLTLIGLLALKKAAVATPFMFPLIIFTILFNFYIRMRHFHVTNHLPTRECLELDRKNHMNGGLDFEFLLGKYLQPALQSKTIYINNLDLTTCRVTRRDTAQDNTTN